MIFDEGDLCGRRASQAKPSQTSLDLLWLDRRQRLSRRDFSDLYQAFRVELNRDFFASGLSSLLREDRVLTRRQRKIHKHPLPPLSTHAPPCFSLKSLGHSRISLGKLPPIEEEKRKFASSIRELANIENVNPQVEERGRGHSLGSLGKLFSLNALPEPEKTTTLKSLESLDAPQKKQRQLCVEGKACPSCAKKFSLKTRIAVTNSCGHVFHEECLKKALESVVDVEEPKCPFCSRLL